MSLAAAASARSSRRRFAGVLRARWQRVLVGGSVVYGLVTLAAVSTQNINLVPAVLVLGALLVPVTFVMFVFERLSLPASVLPPLALCFAGGGSLGVAAASVLEYQTLRDLGALPMLAVGLIEETVKLVIPLWLLARGRFRAPADGVLFGVAAGMGFAALETMGYGLVALIQSHGQITAAEDVLLFRGLLSPVGHAAWTGLVCAALWRRPRPWLAVPAAFAAAVALHALWDSFTGIGAHIAIGLFSGVLLAAQIRRARRAGMARRQV